MILNFSKLLVLLLSFVIAQCSLLHGQSGERASYEKNGLKFTVDAPATAEPGNTFALNLKLEIPDGHHIYGAKDQTMPTELTLAEVEGVQFSDPEVPSGKRHSKSGMTNYWLEGEQTFGAEVSVDKDFEGELKVAGTLKFMICNDRICKPPAKVPFEFVVAINNGSESASPTSDEMFEAPVRVKAGGEVISTEEPGYASPWLADIDDDGIKDLLVGQFNMGKIKVYKGTGKGEFSEGKWLKVGGKVAEVPGVW